jgi:hypothetical protein
VVADVRMPDTIERRDDETGNGIQTSSRVYGVIASRSA